jgi:hypothetical protein
MRKSGLADSPFFSVKNTQDKVNTPLLEKSILKKTKKKKRKSRPTSSHHDTMTPRNHDTTTPRYHDTIVELVRSAVKEFGKEAATHRFTIEEKKAIADIIYLYKRRAIKTSENEITRISVNFIINDHKENGPNSILAKVLKALNR